MFEEGVGSDFISICFRKIRSSKSLNRAIVTIARHHLNCSLFKLLVLVGFMLFNGSTTGATRGTGTANPPGAPEFTSAFVLLEL